MSPLCARRLKMIRTEIAPQNPRPRKSGVAAPDRRLGDRYEATGMVVSNRQAVARRSS
jgi:hypothetical protein